MARGGVALAFDLIARDGASPTFARVAASADKAAAATARAEKGMLGFSKRAMAGLGALASIDFAVHAVKDAAQFESAMNRIHTVVGASTEEVRTMSKAMLGLAGEVAQSPEHLATSLYHMEAIGLRGSKALDAVRAAAQGAKIGNADLEETTNALTATIQSGIAGNQDYTKTMSQLLTIVGTGDMKLQDFNEALGSGLLAVMANAGVSLRDVGAALAVFGDNNIRGADAATMLRVAVQAMQAPAKGGAKALASIGLNAHALKDDLLRGGLNAAISDLKKHLDDSGNSGKRAGALIVEAFGKKANTGIGVLIHEYDLLQKKYGIIDKNTDNFREKWQATTKTAAFALDKLRAQFEVVAITVGTKLIPPVTAFVNFLTHNVGPNLVGPWHALEAVLSVVGAAFSAVGRVVGALHLPVAQIGIAAVGAFAAFKVFSLVPAMIDAIHFRFLLVGESLSKLGGVARGAGAAVAEGGAVASVGWRGLLGPLAAVGIGVGLLISMFHKSDTASKAAAEAARAYGDALAQGADNTTMIDTIREQLKSNDVPQKIAKLNESLGIGTYNGNQFVKAISAGGPALANLGGRLEAVITKNYELYAAEVKAGRGNSDAAKQYKKRADAAQNLLGVIDTQVGALSAKALKDLQDTKAFAGVSSSIDKVSQATQVGSDTAKQYAGMLGIVVDKNGIAAVSSKALQAAVDTVSKAYANATGAGDDFLKAFAAFGQSAGTAADRAALIGSTLKAANGNALGFAAAMTGTTSAINSLTGAFHDQRQQLAQQSADQQKAAAGITSAHRSVSAAQQRVIAAQERLNEVRANSKSTDTQLRSAQASLTSAQNAAADAADRLSSAQSSAGQAGALAYADTERAAIHFRQTVHGLSATIDTNARGAGDLVSQLQGMQTAAMAAASAMYQNEVATKGGKKAADDAYNIYNTKTRRALIDQHKQLGLTVPQAQALATAYFGMPKHVRTLIKQEGANPIVTVLNKIGTLLANLTGQPWDIAVNVVTRGKLPHQAPTDKNGNIVGPGYAVGTDYASPGWRWVGENGPELMRFHGGEQIKTAPRSKSFANSAPASKTTNVNIAKQELHVHYPLEGGLTEALPQLMRAASNQIGRALS